MDSLRDSGGLGVLGCVYVWFGGDQDMYFSAPQLKKVAGEGRFQLGLPRYVP